MSLLDVESWIHLVCWTCICIPKGTLKTHENSKTEQKLHMFPVTPQDSGVCDLVQGSLSDKNKSVCLPKKMADNSRSESARADYTRSYKEQRRQSWLVAYQLSILVDCPNQLIHIGISICWVGGGDPCGVADFCFSGVYCHKKQS